MSKFVFDCAEELEVGFEILIDVADGSHVSTTVSLVASPDAFRVAWNVTVERIGHKESLKPKPMASQCEARPDKEE